jgi:peptidoglycan/LPS O-acetylase OafA/YrhL
MEQRPQGKNPVLVPPGSRRPELDVMRALVVAGLVVFHSAVVFASGTSWFINDPRPSPGFTVFLLWGSLWGMPLLFLVSGMGARYALRSRSAGAFTRERLGRLLIPLLTGLALLVAPMF